MTTFAIKDLECKSFVTNELLDVIASQMIFEKDGLTQIVLSNFKEICGPFDESLLDRFVNASIKLQKLEVTDMSHLTSDSRQQLTNMVVKII